MKTGSVLFYRDADKQWWWRVTASNGRIIGGSTERYKKRSAAIANYTAITGKTVFLDRRETKGGEVHRAWRP